MMHSGFMILLVMAAWLFPVIKPLRIHCTCRLTSKQLTLSHDFKPTSDWEVS